MADVVGDFDVHLTVLGRQGGELVAFAERHGLGYTHIVLDRGDTAFQPMLNLRGSGTLAEQLAFARSWEEKLRAADLEVVRVKVEAAPWSTGIPATDEAAAMEPAQRYFEHHVKVLLPDADPARLVALTDLVAPHGARLSRNARRQRSDGGQERFVTQRCRRVGQPTARQRLAALLTALHSGGHDVVKFEEEYVVLDSAQSLDGGWLESPRGQG